MSNQTVTRTIESDLEPKPIFLKLKDASQIPQWAPVFADKVEHTQGTIFHVTKNAEVFDFELITNEASLTVDYLRSMANGKRGGAYIRVMPRPLGGSAISMTVPIGPNTTTEQVAAVLEQELEALLKLIQP